MAIITLAEAKKHLTITGATHDAELPGFISAAEKAIVDHIGIVESTAGQTCRIRGGGRGLAFPAAARVISVQSVTPVGGSAISLTLLFIDEEHGVIEYDDGSMFYERAYDVVYTAGFATVPANIKMAALEQVKSQWATKRGPSGPRQGGDEQTPADEPVMSRRVRELLAPYRRVLVA